MQLKFQKVAAAISAAVVGIALIGCRQEPKAGFTVGVLLPLTGESAPYGTECRDGAKLAFDAAKDVRVIFEDSKEDPMETMTAFRKLSSLNGIEALLGSMFSITSLPLAPAANRAKVVMLTPASSDPNVPLTGEYIFSLYPSAELEGQLAASAVIDAGVKNLVVLYQNVKAAKDLSVAMTNCLKTQGLESRTLIMPEQALDYPRFIAQLGKPEAVFICAYKDPLLRFVEKSRELGMETRWFSQSTLYEPAAIKKYANELEGTIFTAPYFNQESNDPGVAEFRSAFSAAYKREPTVWSAFGYDGAKLLLQAYEASKSSGRDLKTALLQANLQGATGSTSFDENRRPIKKMVIMQIKNGAPVIINHNPQSPCPTK